VNTQVRQVFFIHTVTGLESMFTDLCREYLPDAELCHIADESLIRGVLAAGGVTAATHHRMREHVMAAAEAGADAIQVTCSSVSPCVDVAKHAVSVPVLKIDEPMVEQAVDRFTRIGVIATTPTTLRPTTDLLQEKARCMHRSIEVTAVLCEGAYDARFCGDIAEHDRIVLAHLRRFLPEVEVVLLAQASMARVADMLGQDEQATPILSSPRPAMERLAAVVSAI